MLTIRPITCLTCTQGEIFTIQCRPSGEAYALLHSRSRELDEVRAEIEQQRRELKKKQQAAGSGSGQGFFSAFIAASVAGIISALTRKLTASTRRRSSYSRTRTSTARRRTTTRRRTANASVEDVFRDILGKIGK